MEKVICDKCGYEVCYNDVDGWGTLYLKCSNCNEVLIDKDVEELVMAG